MLRWFIAGLALLALALLSIKLFVGANPGTLARRLKTVAGWALIFLAVPAILLGRFLFGVPLMALGVAVLASRDSGGAPSATQPGPASQVATDWLAMTLDHASGALDGEVKKGAFAGKRLGELTQEQVMALLAECRASDAQSASLIETYLDRVYGTEWRNATAGRQEPPRTDRGGRMIRDEALQILGLQDTATAEQIKDAHRRLMMKVHPDQGGSDYLAAKLNEAKDVLLGT
jgi:hypothetical protein